MKFRLTQKAAGRSGPSGMATFTVTDEKGAVRGTISVPSSESDDLVKSWAGAFVAVPKLGNKDAMAKVLMKNRTKVSRQALLRT